jgi:hypothetical protein
LRILYCWIANNTTYAMREMSIIMYNSMLCVKFWGAGVAYIKELCDIIKRRPTKYDRPYWRHSRTRRQT